MFASHLPSPLAPQERAPLRRRSRAAAAPRASSSPAAPLLCSEAQELSTSLVALGVPLKRQWIVVLGPNSDTRAVALYESALANTLKLGSEDGAEERRLRRGLDALRELREEQEEEAERFAAAAKKRAEMSAKSELTEAERAALGKGVSGVFMAGVQSSIWSSFLMLGIGLLLLTQLQGR